MDFLAPVDNELDVRMKSIAGQITYICIPIFVLPIFVLPIFVLAVLRRELVL